MKTEKDAIRNPRDGRAKTHRIARVPVGIGYVACGASVGVWSKAERLPAVRTAPEDRCKRCFPPVSNGDTDG